jgi:hypothetical protein
LDICFQVALVVFLAHIGSFVPADSAIVGLTDRLLYPLKIILHFTCFLC